MNESSCYSTFSPPLGCCQRLDFGHSSKCVVIGHCLNLHFPDDIRCGASFHVLICHLYIFFSEVSVRSSAHFLIGLFGFLLLSCMSCLYILEIKPLLVTSFANIFSHSVDCLFVLFMVSFAVQKLVSLIRSHLFIFLLPIALGD